MHKTEKLVRFSYIGCGARSPQSVELAEKFGGFGVTGDYGHVDVKEDGCYVGYFDKGKIVPVSPWGIYLNGNRVGRHYPNGLKIESRGEHLNCVHLATGDTLIAGFTLHELSDCLVNSWSRKRVDSVSMLETAKSFFAD